jgi:hypothetical protein
MPLFYLGLKCPWNKIEVNVIISNESDLLGYLVLDSPGKNREEMSDYSVKRLWQTLRWYVL